MSTGTSPLLTESLFGSLIFLTLHCIAAKPTEALVHKHNVEPIILQGMFTAMDIFNINGTAGRREMPLKHKMAPPTVSSCCMSTVCASPRDNKQSLHTSVRM